jgi:hypothetical protein
MKDRVDPMKIMLEMRSTMVIGGEVEDRVNL